MTDYDPVGAFDACLSSAPIDAVEYVAAALENTADDTDDDRAGLAEEIEKRLDGMGVEANPDVLLSRVLNGDRIYSVVGLAITGGDARDRGDG